MNLSEILRYAFLGSVVYGAYKLGEKNGKSMNQNDGYIPDSKRYSEEEYIMDEIEALKRKPNKTRKISPRVYPSLLQWAEFILEPVMETNS
jgi:hypothetical protein